MNAVEKSSLQHLIDPENCARCGSCESECSAQAISHDARNFVVDAEKCSACEECVAVCPTGAIDFWLAPPAAGAYSLAEQLSWDSLPEQSSGVAPMTLFSVAAPLLATVIENRRLTPVDCGSDIRHIVLALGDTTLPFLEGQTLGILAAGSDVDGRAHPMRAYSIASSRAGEGGVANTVALTVKRVTALDTGQLPGVCSNYLCDRASGDQVALTGPHGHGFLLPATSPSENEAPPLLLIGTGTGIAPLRGMIQQLLRTAATTTIAAAEPALLLFYGARGPAEMPYLDELAALPASLIDFNPVFSRSPQHPRRYVQDALLQRGAQALGWLRDPRCHVYLCGLRGLEAGIEAVFARLCAECGEDWPALRDRLQRESRWHSEVY